ncbi:MAG: EAL domain-containing protein [Thalassolituus sp.]
MGFDMACQLADAIDVGQLQGEKAYNTAIQSLIHSVRRRLNMEVGFVSEFSSGRRYFRYLDATLGATSIGIGDSDPLGESYCHKIAEGQLPEVIPNTSDNSITSAMAVTERLQIASYIGVPIILSDGSVFGTFCVFSRYTVQGLNHRSLTLMRVFADVIASLIEDSRSAFAASVRRKEDITGMIDRDELVLHAQPIYGLSGMSIVGYELLARSSCNPEFCPETFFHDVDQLGLSSIVGLRMVELVQQALNNLPPACYVAMNVTPQFLTNFDLLEWFSPDDSQRLVLELTEHRQITDYIAMKRRLQPLRDAGMKLAIDDAGAGYASMRHILQLSPDIIKLDMSLIRDIHLQPEHQSLLAALQVFARTQGYSIVAEGIEVAEELSFLRTAAVCCGQGYFLSHPEPLGYFTG